MDVNQHTNKHPSIYTYSLHHSLTYSAHTNLVCRSQKVVERDNGEDDEDDGDDDDEGDDRFDMMFDSMYAL